MKPTSKSKLLAYSGLAAAFVAIEKPVAAQFYYNDFDPDVNLSALTTFAYGELLIDLDLDGLTDYRVFAANSLSAWGEVSYQELVVQPNGPNEVAIVSYTGGNYLASALYPGDVVSPAMNWQNENGHIAFFSQTLYYGGTAGQQLSAFPDNGPAFVGLRVIDDGKWYYGWLRVERNAYGELDIFDHLLSPVPNQSVTVSDPMLANCESPVGLTSAVSGSSVSMNWNPVADAVKYQVDGGKFGTLSNFKKLRTPNNLSVPFLGSGSYYWRTRALCSDGAISPLSGLNTFVISAPLTTTDESLEHKGKDVKLITE